VEGRGREADQGDKEDDGESSSSRYESPKDPFAQESGRRPTEEELDQDFDSNGEVGMEPL